MHIMLERIRTRVNSRYIFNIARIQPTGSMAERTSLWKYGLRRNLYLEFDFLAVLQKSIKKCQGTIIRNYCRGCIKLVKPALNLERLGQWYTDSDGVSKVSIEHFFLREINYSLTTSCDCLSFSTHNLEISVKPVSDEKEQGCHKCTVNTPTGTLSVNTERCIRMSGPSLIFKWTSRAKSLSPPSLHLSQERQEIPDLLPIDVDFLPALESLKPSSLGAGDEHDFFIVPKHCNQCDSWKTYDHMRWQKSVCRAETNVIGIEMSNKHRQCYQIINYILMLSSGIIKKNHLKTVVLNHHIRCSDTTDCTVDCVIEMFRDLHWAFVTKELHVYMYQTNINMLNKEFDSHGVQEGTCEELLGILLSLSGSDSWETFVDKTIHVH